MDMTTTDRRRRVRAKDNLPPFAWHYAKPPSSIQAEQQRVAAVAGIFLPVVGLLRQLPAALHRKAALVKHLQQNAHPGVAAAAEMQAAMRINIQCCSGWSLQRDLFAFIDDLENILI